MCIRCHVRIKDAYRGWYGWEAHFNSMLVISTQSMWSTNVKNERKKLLHGVMVRSLSAERRQTKQRTSREVVEVQQELINMLANRKACHHYSFCQYQASTGGSFIGEGSFRKEDPFSKKGSYRKEELFRMKISFSKEDSFRKEGSDRKEGSYSKEGSYRKEGRKSGKQETAGQGRVGRPSIAIKIRCRRIIKKRILVK